MFASTINSLDSDFFSENDDVSLITKSILENALEMGASDIKIDTTSMGCSIDFKIEGLMEIFTIIPETLSSYFISFFQKISGLTVGNLEKAEDSSFHLKEYKCSFRVSQIYKSGGDIVIVIRLLREHKINSLDKLNLESGFKEALRESLRRKEGLIILAGPTDSGKTTTICAAIKELNGQRLNILSAEDPIEYKLDGVSQIQIKEDFGFEKIMRQFLRLNPDVIFLGEIRDSVSAHLCIEASRTGHLVITTIHANSPESIKKRFIDDFKVNASDYEDFLVMSSSQRLIRQSDNKRKPVIEFVTGGNHASNI